VKLGAEPKKLAILVVLLVAAAVLIYQNVLSGPDYGVPSSGRSVPPPKSVAIRAPAGDTAAAPSQPQTSRPAARSSRSAPQEFRPSLKARRPEDRPDPMTVDPNLRLDLLAKLQTVKIAGGNRSLFEFSQPPVAKVKEPKILPKPVEKTEAEKEEEAKRAQAKPAKPPPPPIPLKFYGYVASRGAATRRAFFLKDDEILVAGEGELIEKRYKIVRISLNSAIVEDTQHEDHRQTLVLEEPPPPA
jgi:hypothetical protein